MKKILLNTLMASLCAFGLVAATMITANSQERTEKLIKSAAPHLRIPGRYIVVLKDWAVDAFTGNSKVEDTASELSNVYSGDSRKVVKRVYKNAFKGYTAEMTEDAAKRLSNDPRVEFVEQDSWVRANTIQTSATWGLDRIDQRDRPVDASYNYTPTGNGVNAYIIDTGILINHNQFGGRAAVGYDSIGDGRNGIDCYGHGTHVAATVGGTTYGVAKNVRLYSVRVLDCGGSGTTSGVIAGVDWVKTNHIKPAVANMSLGGGASTALDNAIQNAVAAGVTFVVAAGNENQNACNVSPARAANAITVGAVTNVDARASFSNYGTCVDIFAPGSNITSAWHSSPTAIRTISGTSMASPHVAGVAALYLQSNPTALPAAVTNAIKTSGSSNKLTSINTGSPNLLLYSLVTSGSPLPVAPVCGGTIYTGSLSGSGASTYQPNNNYQTLITGVHTGNLTGPSNADFDLYLEKWNGYAWVTVAFSESETSTEQVSYNGTAGYYRFRITSYSGSGSYSLCTVTPSGRVGVTKAGLK